MRPNLITRLKEEWNNLDPVDPLRGLIADAIDALAEPAQQSKPWKGLTDIERAEVQYKAHKKGLTPLEFMELHEAKMRKKNAAPCKPLTDEQIDGISRQPHGGADPQEWTRNFARAIEAAHGIKE